MSAATQLEAGGLLPARTKADADATEQIVARTYRHPALKDRAVVRLASDRLGQAEDLAMEFLGFEAPDVSPPVAIQQRRSLGFAAWALINDPANARFALDLVKQMKKTARQARSKPGHAWDAYAAMAKELGRSARHFLPPFWEEAGRAFKDIGNQTYAGRALNKSLEAERVHAIDSDRARRRDVVLEFVLSGCLAGAALSEYGNDLQAQYPPEEAFSIFRDLCVRRTRGGMAPWAALPKDLAKLARAAKRNSDEEIEAFLEEVIETPAMGRAPLQLWKSCSAHCRRIVERNPSFAVALLRHTKPEPRYYGESKLGPWFELLKEWGVYEFLWQEGHRGAPSLGEPVAHWFARIIQDEVPAPLRTLEMLEKLTPRLKAEKTPLQLAPSGRRYGGGSVDVDVLEACLASGIKVDDPPEEFDVTFDGWLAAEVDHPHRNRDLIECGQDDRFKRAVLQGLENALTCKGGTRERGYRQPKLEQRPFPLAASDRPGILKLWHIQAAEAISELEGTGLASFVVALERINKTLWPDTLRLFPDLAERLQRIDPVAMLQRTLQGGCFDEYGLPALEQAVETAKIKINRSNYDESNIHESFPFIVIRDSIHAYIIDSDGQVRKRELHLPKMAEVTSMVVVGDDLAVTYRDSSYNRFLYWVSNPAQKFPSNRWYSRDIFQGTTLPDGSVFFGDHAVRPGDNDLPQAQQYFHDGERFWRVIGTYDNTIHEHRWSIREVDPQTGKLDRESVPPWFEQSEGKIDYNASELMVAPGGAEESPLGFKNGLLGWKTLERREGSSEGEGIDGRRPEKPVPSGTMVGLLNQPGTSAYLPVSTGGSRGSSYRIWDQTGTTAIADLTDYGHEYAAGQVLVLPLVFWHLLKVRDVTASRLLRKASMEQCAKLYQAASEDRAKHVGVPSAAGPSEVALTKLLPAVKHWLPSAPERMALGVARLIEHAEKTGSSFTTLRDTAAAKKESPSAALLSHRKSDTAAAHWQLQHIHSYGSENETSVSAHMHAVAEFLKGAAKPGSLPRTNYLWFPMLENLALRFWQTYWRATAAGMGGKTPVPWLEFAKHWHDLGLADLPGRLDIMEGFPVGAKKRSYGGYDVEVEGGMAHCVESGDDRFIVIQGSSYHYDGFPYHFLRYSQSKQPGPLAGFELRNIRRVKLSPTSELAAMIAAAEACQGLPVPSLDELRECAERLSVSTSEIALVWIGGLNIDSYQHNFLPAEIRTALGLKANEASAARQALRNLNQALTAKLFEAVVSLGGATPFAADRRPILQAIEKLWRGQMPTRLPLDAAMQKRLSALGVTPRWQQQQNEELLAAAADPTNHPLLQPRIHEIKLSAGQYESLSVEAKSKGESAFDPVILRSVAQLVAVIHAETPAGAPARAAMPALIKQTTKLLDHAGTMLDLREIQLFTDGRKKMPTATEWLNTHLGKTKTDAKAKASTFDDGLLAAIGLDRIHQALVAFRPAKLKSANDVARLRAILGADAGPYSPAESAILPAVLALKSAGFQKLAKAILAKELKEGQWPANPKLTAPAVVAAIQKKYKLGEDAAVLYAQLLAVPDPTSAHVCAWNGWSAAQYKKAAAELVTKKLALEASRARAGRAIFLPGEWSELKSPWIPIEKWKLAHLCETDGLAADELPLGGPLVLRPFEELFAAAWQRVLDGDEPRYEEVKRKKKK